MSNLIVLTVKLIQNLNKRHLFGKQLETQKSQIYVQNMKTK